MLPCNCFSQCNFFTINLLLYWTQPASVFGDHKIEQLMNIVPIMVFNLRFLPFGILPVICKTQTFSHFSSVLKFISWFNNPENINKWNITVIKIPEIKICENLRQIILLNVWTIGKTLSESTGRCADNFDHVCICKIFN